MVSITPVFAENFKDWQEAVKWHFHNFAERSNGEITADELREDVQNKDRQMWVVTKGDTVMAVALTRVLPRNVVEITQCAGEDREEWQVLMLQTIGAWAYELGADHLRVIHRPGWTPFMRKMGLKKTHVVSEIRWDRENELR